MTSLPITLLSRKDTFKCSDARKKKHLTFDLNKENCYWLRLSDKIHIFAMLNLTMYDYKIISDSSARLIIMW